MANVIVVDSNNVKIGYNITISSPVTNCSIVGNSVLIDNIGVASGVEADGVTGIGRDITIHGTRNVYLGNGIQITGISCTALGYFAKITPRPIAANETPLHTYCAGRGAYNPFPGSVVIGNAGGAAPFDVYFNNGWTHRFVDPANRTGTPTTRNLASMPLVIHGPDAYDDYNGTDTGDGININVSAGDLINMAGRPTGNGTPGQYKVQIADGLNLAGNKKQNVIDAFVVKFTSTLGETFINIADENKILNRVKYYVDENGRKVLYF